jgi:hypothetical protein
VDHARRFVAGRSTLRVAVGLLVSAAAFVTPRAVRADSLEGISLFPLGDKPRAGAELETAGFHLQGRRGSYASFIPRFEWNATELLGIRVRMPIYSLALDGVGDTREGLGDTELRARFHLLGGEPLRISAGWVTQLPTGSASRGLGEGALQGVPFVNFGFRVSRVVIYLTIADALSFAGPHQKRLANYVDPGSDHELRTTIGTIFSFTDKVSGSLIFTETTILTSVDRGRSFVTSAIQLGTQPDPRLRLTLAQQLPVVGEERFSWKLNAAASYAF